MTLTRTDKELTADDYTITGDLLTIKTAGNYTLSGTASSNDFRVKVGDRLVTTLTIDNLTINTYRDEKENEAKQGYSPLDFSDAGATTLILVGKNQLTARAQNPAVFAPKVEKDDDLAVQLTIGGEGSLVATGGYAWPGIGNTGSAKIRIEGGDITAQGGYAAAGIGGSWGFWFDSIVITGGCVVATGGAWANNDIGCGYAPSKKPNHGTNREHVISIEGGVVEAERIYEDTNENTLKKTGGILVRNGEYTVLGDTKLTTNLTILEGKTLTVPSGKTITIEKNGKLEIEKGAQLYVDGTVQGNITGAGKSITNSITIWTAANGKTATSRRTIICRALGLIFRRKKTSIKRDIISWAGRTRPLVKRSRKFRRTQPVSKALSRSGKRSFLRLRPCRMRLVCRRRATLPRRWRGARWVWPALRGWRR